MRGAKSFLLLSLFALLGIGGGIVCLFNDVLYLIEGVTVDAHVTNHETLRQDDSSEYLLYYTFTTKEGKEFDTDNDFGQDFYRLKVGDTFKLQYLPDDPYVDRPVGSDDDVWVGVISIIIGLVCFVMLRLSLLISPGQFG